MEAFNKPTEETYSEIRNLVVATLQAPERTAFRERLMELNNAIDSNIACLHLSNWQTKLDPPNALEMIYDMAKTKDIVYIQPYIQDLILKANPFNNVSLKDADIVLPRIFEAKNAEDLAFNLKLFHSLLDKSSFNEKVFLREKFELKGNFKLLDAKIVEFQDPYIFELRHQIFRDFYSNDPSNCLGLNSLTRRLKPVFRIFVEF